MKNYFFAVTIIVTIFWSCDEPENKLEEEFTKTSQQENSGDFLLENLSLECLKKRLKECETAVAYFENHSNDEDYLGMSEDEANLCVEIVSALIEQKMIDFDKLTGYARVLIDAPLPERCPEDDNQGNCPRDLSDLKRLFIAQEIEGDHLDIELVNRYGEPVGEFGSPERLEDGSLFVPFYKYEEMDYSGPVSFVIESLEEANQDNCPQYFQNKRK